MPKQNAIVLSLGMLLEKVDSSGFIAKLLKKAIEENNQFAFTPEMQKTAFFLSEQFNRGQIKSDEFATQLLGLLGIKNMQSSEFWDEWNSMVILGNVAEKIQQLQSITNQHNVLIYLSSDTNDIHLQKIASESQQQKINLDTTKQPMTFEQLPLYVSCQVGKNRLALIQHAISDIRSKEFKPDTITLILGNPENVKDEKHKAVVTKECNAVVNWCKENGILVQLHNNSLNETFMKIFAPESAAVSTPKVAFS